MEQFFVVTLFYVVLSYSLITNIELNRLLMNVIEGVNLCYIHDENKLTKCKRRA